MERVLLTVNQDQQALETGQNASSLPVPTSIEDWEAQVQRARDARASVLVGPPPDAPIDVQAE